jgi:hypothetical protein
VTDFVYRSILIGATIMKRFTFFLIAVATTVGLVALIRAAAGHADGQSAPYVTDIPSGYRDWQWISSAHEAGNLNSLGAVLGNDVAIKAFRSGKLPFPDGITMSSPAPTSPLERIGVSQGSDSAYFSASRPTSLAFLSSRKPMNCVRRRKNLPRTQPLHNRL